MREHISLIEIDVNEHISAMTFTPNGEYLVGGGREMIRMWRVRDGKQVATMQAGNVRCLAVSKDGRWIAAGTNWGKALVWDAQTYERVFEEDDSYSIDGVDFSPDSTRLVVSWWGTTTVWDMVTRQRVRGPRGDLSEVVAARYSPQGDRIAIATRTAVQVWDSSDGRLLVTVPVQVTTRYNTGLVWLNNHLLVVSNNKIKEINASTGSTVSEWAVPDTDSTSCIALPRHGKFIAYSGGDTVLFWDTLQHTQLYLVPRLRDIDSVAISPDDRHFAIVSRDRKITIKCLSQTINVESFTLSHLHPTFQEPEIRINGAALDSWKAGRIADADALLTTILRFQSTAHHVLASRALIRTRLQQWDAAIVDAEQSLRIEPSVIGYVAMCVALVGKGRIHQGFRACDIAFEHFHSTHVTFLLLIKAVVLFTAGEHDDAISRMDNLITTVHHNSTFYTAYMYVLLGNLQMKSGDYERAIQSFNLAQAQLGCRTGQPPLIVSLISGWNFDDLAIRTQQCLCEALCTAGRTEEAGDSLLYMEVDMIGSFAWVCDLMQKCLSTPDRASNIRQNIQHDNPPTIRDQYPAPLLKKWAKLKLATDSWKGALTTAINFLHPRIETYRVICEYLESIDHVTDAVACFHEMNSELGQRVENEQASWILDFKTRWCGRLESLGDTALDTLRYDEATSHYTTALLLVPAAPDALLAKRSRAYAEMRRWEDALNDANEVIRLDPSSPFGYERKHAALRGAGRYGDAIDAFEAMLSKISHSAVPEIREKADQYVTLEQTKGTIGTIIEDFIRETPPVLINTTSGRLCNKFEQARAFGSMPVFADLVSSMTTYIDPTRIEQEVREYYRYATFSHKWEDNEPLFEEVTKVAVYDLDRSPTHKKLQMFCKTVRDAGFHWAWSDTCCINKGDHFVLQEALVSMFKWFQGSSLTVVFLRGVPHLSSRGALMRSTWNTRAWTLQEYHASKVVRFYTEDWTPYLNLGIYNHKESSEILSEMEVATGTSAQALMELRPGLDDIQEKLRLASTRQTTRVEDAAYSLLGIFSMTLPVVYGEGDRALGRLLAQLLTSSGEASIIAWTGRSGSFNSCLPDSIAVFGLSSAPHIPPDTADAKMQTTAGGLRIAASILSPATKLYDRLSDLPVPSFLVQRMKLPCLAFKLGPVSPASEPERSFRAQAAALGIVRIKTKENLSRLDTLYLIHPWIDFLLDRRPVWNMKETASHEDTDDQSSWANVSLSSRSLSNASALAISRTGTLGFVSRLGRTFGGRAAPSVEDMDSLPPPSITSPVEKQTRVLRFIARLKQPFGALLFTPTRQHVEEYRRVATDTLITVQLEEITPAMLERLVQSVRTLDVL